MPSFVHHVCAHVAEHHDCFVLQLFSKADGVMQPQAQAFPLQPSVNAKWQEWRQHRRSLSPEPFQRPTSHGIKAESGTNIQGCQWIAEGIDACTATSVSTSANISSLPLR